MPIHACFYSLIHVSSAMCIARSTTERFELHTGKSDHLAKSSHSLPYIFTFIFFNKNTIYTSLTLPKNHLFGNIFDIFPYDCGLQTLNLNGNRLEGVVPRSLANCINLEVFDIGNNEINDVFPCYLTSISKLSPYLAI